MNVRAVICQASPVRIWGLTSTERLVRYLAKRGIPVIGEDALPHDGTVIVLRGDHVYDDRALDAVVDRGGIVLRPSDADRGAVGAHVEANRAEDAVHWVATRSTESSSDVDAVSPVTLVASTRLTLLKAQASFAMEVTESNRRFVERFLFDASYKGVTDCVTKWLWPPPARWAVRLCVRCGLRPNHVTGLGFTLMVLALVLFDRGIYGWGLAAAWMMTFLDTVDGKLARTTLTSSRFGHYLDKLTDIVHPPFWYLAWAQGLVTYASPTPDIPLTTMVWSIFGFYLLGRLAEGIGSGVFVSGGLFVWRPLDSYFRLITARRNTCLLLLTGGLIGGRPDLGLWAVAAWTAATSLFLVARVGVAWKAWRNNTRESLGSWLADVDLTAADVTRAARLFSQRRRVQE